jgi:hypothetical protein
LATQIKEALAWHTLEIALEDAIAGGNGLIEANNAALTAGKPPTVSGNIAESKRELADRVGDVILRNMGHMRGLA